MSTDILTTQEVAERFGRTVRAVEHWAAKGCPCDKDEAGFLAWPVEEVEGWLRETKRWAKIQKDLAAGAARKKPGPKANPATIRRAAAGGSSPSKQVKKPAGRRRSKPARAKTARERARETREATVNPQAQALTAARRRKEEALALKHELSARKLSGQNIDRRAAIQAFTILAEHFNSLTMAIPARLAGRVARTKRTDEAFTILEDAMEGLRHDLATEFARVEGGLSE